MDATPQQVGLGGELALKFLAGAISAQATIESREFDVE
jgi:hypothetical protein